MMARSRRLTFSPLLILAPLWLACGKSPAPPSNSVDAQSVDAQSVDARFIAPDAESVDAQSVDAESVDARFIAPDTNPTSVDARFIAPDTNPTSVDARFIAPTITLLQPGDAPRHRVRYSLPTEASPATPTTLPLRLALDFTASSDGQPMSLPMPPLSLVIAATPKSDTLTLAVQRVEVADGAPPHLAGLLRSLAGLSGDRPFSARGLPPTTTPLFPPPNTAALAPLLDGFSQALEQLVVPLPDEAVGPGARWLQRLPVTQHGVTFEQLTTWTLVARTDGALSLAYTVELRLGDNPERRLSPPKSPIEGTVQSVDGRGTGTVMLALGPAKNDELALPSPLPLRVTGDHTLALDLEVSASPSPKRLTIQSRMALSTDDPKAE
jgi:hypothetical protein